ncbi:MAG: hypothetical protein AAGI37_12525 [Planctomycetota bacterium]
MATRIRLPKTFTHNGIKYRAIFWDEDARQTMPSMPFVVFNSPAFEDETVLHVRNEHTKQDVRACCEVAREFSPEDEFIAVPVGSVKVIHEIAEVSLQEGGAA